MKIILCGSRKMIKRILSIGKELKQFGHTVWLPTDNNRYSKYKDTNSILFKQMNKIKNSDAILVANIEEDGQKNYIDADTFMEMGYAHYLGKKIFMLNDLPDEPYIKDKISSMHGVVLRNDISKLLI